MQRAVIAALTRKVGARQVRASLPVSSTALFQLSGQQLALPSHRGYSFVTSSAVGCRWSERSCKMQARRSSTRAEVREAGEITTDASTKDTADDFIISVSKPARLHGRRVCSPPACKNHGRMHGCSRFHFLGYLYQLVYIHTCAIIEHAHIDPQSMRV